MEITRRAITATSLSSLFAIFCSLSHATELETASEEVIISGDEQEVIVDAYSDEIQQTTELEAVEVIAQKTKSEEYIRKQNSTGAIFALTNQETPQAMTFVTHAQIEDFELTTVKDVLSVASGVALEQNEPARFYARSRGFLVDQMATDGVGFPSLYDNFYGSIDAAVYDSVEILRGANGMMNGTGNPSATINLIRKKPTEQNEGKIKVTFDQFGGYRGDLDLSNVLNESGSTKGRLVIAHAGGDTYLEHYEPTSNVVYGIVDFQLMDSLKLTLGNEYNHQYSQGVMWGSLPLVDNRLEPVEYPVETSAAAKWSHATNVKNNIFGALEAGLGDWNLKLSADYIYQDFAAEWLYHVNTLNPISPNQLYTRPQRYDYTTSSGIIDFRADTFFDLFDRYHEIGFGLQYAQNETQDRSTRSSEDMELIDDLRTWDNDPEQVPFDTPSASGDVERDQTSAYFTANLYLRDQLSLLLGGRFLNYQAQGQGYGINYDNEYWSVSPAVGLTYTIEDSGTSVYTSYNQIFKPQTKQDVNNEILDPISGQTIEMGLKQAIAGGDLLLSFAIFNTTQKNVPVAVGLREEDFSTIYAAQDELKSNGLEVDFVGRLTEEITLNGGYAYVQILNEDGDEAKTAYPRNMANLSINYQPSALSQLRVGSSLSWQEGIYADLQGVFLGQLPIADQVLPEDSRRTVRIEQSSYVVVNAFAEYSMTENSAVKLNFENIANEKYVNGLYSVEEFAIPQAYYAKPFTVSLSVIGKF